MPTKIELAKQLEAAMGTASSNAAAWYVTKTKAWLEQQLAWNVERAAIKAKFNPALDVQLATNAHNHPADHLCGVCGRWIGHLGYTWAFRLNQAKINEAKPTHQPTRMDWHLIDAYCIECASS
jgi:hypothetical protein